MRGHVYVELFPNLQADAMVDTIIASQFLSSLPLIHSNFHQVGVKRRLTCCSGGSGSGGSCKWSPTPPLSPPEKLTTATIPSLSRRDALTQPPPHHHICQTYHHYHHHFHYYYYYYHSPPTTTSRKEVRSLPGWR